MIAGQPSIPEAAEHAFKPPVVEQPANVAHRSCVTSNAGPHGEAQLYERWRRALQVRQSGADLKPPQAAVVKSDGGERCGNAGTRFRQARSREASASEPLQKCRKRIRRCRNRGVTLPPGSARGMPETARATSGM